MILYKAGFGAQATDPDAPLAHSLYNCKNTINSLVNYIREAGFTVSDVTVLLSEDGKGNFRYDVAKTQPYKGNRTKAVKPVHFDAMKEYLLERYQSILVTGQEADDEMGILATRDPEKHMIISADKDMRMIPCWHYEMGDRPPYYVDDSMGYLELDRVKGKSPKLFGTGWIWFHSQLLTGDRADHIPGIPGVGIVKAHGMLKDCKNKAECVEVVAEAYKKAELDDERLLEVSKLLWIRRERVEVPNAKTVKAMKEAESGEGLSGMVSLNEFFKEVEDDKEEEANS